MALDHPLAQPPGSEPPQAGTETANSRHFTDVPLLTGDQPLPCGRPLSRVWEDARDFDPTADPHTVDCPYCRQAVDGLAALDVAILALRAEERPSAQALADRVMSVVRAEVRLGRMLPLNDPARDLRISETAAAKVLRRAADAVPGVSAGSLRLTPTGDGEAIHIALTLAAALDQPLPERVDQVRRVVFRAAHGILGLAVTSVDVTIADVLEPAQPLGRDAADFREDEIR
ncbi:hypothetical protein [Streptomyces sp. NBC_00046]|uniref:hypothetical protein n=1 Tax=unclassified Streptomyces TaxID=2593676 RepID=UPI003247187D